jgi:hypothetical protein
MTVALEHLSLFWMSMRVHPVTNDSPAGILKAAVGCSAQGHVSAAIAGCTVTAVLPDGWRICPHREKHELFVGCFNAYRTVVTKYHAGVGAYDTLVACRRTPCCHSGFPQSSWTYTGTYGSERVMMVWNELRGKMDLVWHRVNG